MPRLGVLGWPVAHSRSPAIHEAAYRELGMTGWTYQKLPVPPEAFDDTVRALEGSGFLGANVTIPHKEAALALADERTEAAAAIGAANTLTFASGRIHADNTDAPGFLAAVGEPLAGRTAMVLGAGGSARAVVWALVEAGADVMVWNRTPERARALTAELGGRAVDRPQRADLLVNCTAAGLSSEAEFFQDLPLTVEEVSDHPFVVDLVYRDAGTALIKAAQAAGARTIDGVEILIRQAALSFERWTGKAAPIEAMRRGVASA